MKKLLALSFAACMFTFAASAQTDRTTSTTPDAAKQQRHHGKGDKDKMMKELNLSVDQKAQLKAQHKEMKAQRDALKSQGLSDADLKAKEKAMRADQKAKRDAILTADQKTKLADLKQKKMAERKSKGGKFSGKKPVATQTLPTANQ